MKIDGHAACLNGAVILKECYRTWKVKLFTRLPASHPAGCRYSNYVPSHCTGVDSQAMKPAPKAATRRYTARHSRFANYPRFCQQLV